MNLTDVFKNLDEKINLLEKRYSDCKYATSNEALMINKEKDLFTTIINALEQLNGETVKSREVCSTCGHKLTIHEISKGKCYDCGSFLDPEQAE
jgi:hypothetical protein